MECFLGGKCQAQHALVRNWILQVALAFYVLKIEFLVSYKVFLPKVS